MKVSSSLVSLQVCLSTSSVVFSQVAGYSSSRFYSRTGTFHSRLPSQRSISSSNTVNRRYSSNFYYYQLGQQKKQAFKRQTTIPGATTVSSSSLSSTAMNDLLNCPTIPLSNGMKHPIIGFGTYKVGYIPASASSAVATGQAGSTSGNDDGSSKERTAEECVSDALSVGYRFLECAEFYNNESSIGKAIASSGIPRQDLFLCSKVWTTTIEKGPDAIREQVTKTLKDLGTDYLDMYLVHWPVPKHHVSAYKTLVELVKEGKVKSIGLSNYAVEDYQELKNEGALKEVAPVVNQIEINPFLYRQNTINFFEKEGVVLQSYRSLKDGKQFTNPVLMKIAKVHDKSTAQILGRWCVQKGFVYMPKSVKKERMIENSQVFDFKLTDDEMKELDNLTTPDALEAFVQLYRKCVNRDTTKDGTLEGIKMDITVD